MCRSRASFRVFHKVLFPRIEIVTVVALVANIVVYYINVACKGAAGTVTLCAQRACEHDVACYESPVVDCACLVAMVGVLSWLRLCCFGDPSHDVYIVTSQTSE